jgi:hypothetical protein
MPKGVQMNDVSQANRLINHIGGTIGSLQHPGCTNRENLGVDSLTK